MDTKRSVSQDFKKRQFSYVFVYNQKCPLLLLFIVVLLLLLYESELESELFTGGTSE